MICCKCKNAIEEDINFCPFCGASIEQQRKNKKIKIIVGVISFLLVLFIGELVYNYYYEQKMGKPFARERIIGDTPIKFEGHYNKNEKSMYIDLLTEEKIEPWQVESFGNGKVLLTIEFETKSGKKELQYYNITFKTGENLAANYKIENIGFKEYAEIREIFQRTDSKVINIRYNNVITFDSKERAELKKEYLLWKEEQQQAQLRQKQLEAYRRQLQQMYYGYGFYY